MIETSDQSFLKMPCDVPQIGVITANRIQMFTIHYILDYVMCYKILLFQNTRYLMIRSWPRTLVTMVFALVSRPGG